MDLFKNLKPKAHLSRNGFDLSSRQLFTAKAGQLLPVYSMDMVPGDKVTVDLAAISRSMPLNTAAFTRVRQYFHFFYVPYQSLWHQWDSFISQRNNKESSYIQGSSACPVFSKKRLLNEIFSPLVTTGLQESDFKDLHGFDMRHGALKLMDLLGYGSANSYLADPVYAGGDSFAFENISQSLNTSRPNAWRILAYQKIYADYYQNKYYESPDPYTFNVDDVPCNNESDNEIFSARASRSRKPAMDLFSLRYRQWKKDLFMSVMPSPQFGQTASIDITDKTIYLSRINFADNPSLKDTISYTPGQIQAQMSYESKPTPGKPALGFMLTPPTSGEDFTRPKNVGSRWTIQSAIDVLSLRKAEALQRWKENTLRAGRDHKDQQMAHFGIVAKNSFNNHAQYLGGFDSVINIDEVVSTASTQDSILGQLAGKGIGSTGGSSFTHEASDFGVLMCIYSCVPESEYNSTGIDRCNQLTDPFDYFTPEFENLGLEPLSSKDIDDPVMSDASQKVFGYSPRYYAYKAAVDKVHGVFQTSRSLNAWTTPRRDLVKGDAYVQDLTLPKLYVNPRVLDSIFLQQCTDYEDSDQFLINSYFDLKAIRPMSVLGLPYS